MTILDASIQSSIKDILAQNTVVLFMKGEKDQPECGFSAKVVNVLQQLGVDFHAVNILCDPDMRQNMKIFSDWPTFPQLYAHGDFVGGCDIVMDMYQNQQETLKKILG